MILLKRDASQKETVRELDGAEALRILEENSYYNPHLLVHSDFKRRIRGRFFEKLLGSATVFEINTIGTPEESQREIRRIVRMD